MSTKTTFKRIALVAVAALGFGVLSVVPSQADVTGLAITATNGTATTLKSDSSTAASLRVQFLNLGTTDSVTVDVVAAAPLPTGGNLSSSRLFFTESTTSVAGNGPSVDTAAAFVPTAGALTLNDAAGTRDDNFRVISPTVANATSSALVRVSLGETTTGSVVAGVYSLNAIVKSVQGGVVVTQVFPFNITVTAPAAVVVTPAAANAKAYLHAGDTAYPSAGQLADSVTDAVEAIMNALATVAVVLTKDDVRDGRIYIYKSIHGSTKSRSGVRVVPLIGEFYQIPKSPKTLRKVLDPYGIHIHSLRHTYAYLLKTQGIHVTTAQKLLGHSDPKVTLRVYTQVLDNEIENTGEILKRVC